MSFNAWKATHKTGGACNASIIHRVSGCWWPFLGLILTVQGAPPLFPWRFGSLEGSCQGNAWHLRFEVACSELTAQLQGSIFIKNSAAMWLLSPLVLAVDSLMKKGHPDKTQFKVLLSRLHYGPTSNSLTLRTTSQPKKQPSGTSQWEPPIA